MSKKQIKESILEEGTLDTLFKGIVGTYFGSKMIDNYTKKMALKDPKIQKDLKSIKASLNNVDARIAKLRQMGA